MGNLSVKWELRKRGYLVGKGDRYCTICHRQIGNTNHFRKHREIMREIMGEAENEHN
ncbi:hypothetical protein [Caldiplasma sukawensis]